MLRPLVLGSVLLALAGCGTADAAGERAGSLRLEAAETYVRLVPREGELHIREYVLGTRETDPAAMARQAETVTALVRAAEYCTRRFGLPGFSAVEESLFHDRGVLTVDCRLRTEERNLRRLMASAFGGVLGRPVTLTIGGEIGLHFAGPEIQCRGNNALAIMGKGDQRVIYWRNGTPSFELVFGEHGRDTPSFRPLTRYVMEDSIASGVRPWPR